MSILGDIERLITEHGSAAILREKVELLDLQRAQATGERDTLATQLAQAKSKIETLESEKADLQAQLDDARQQIQRLGQRPQDQLPDESEKMLVLIANATRTITSDQAIRHLGLPQAKGDYFFDQLLKRKFVHTSSGQMGVGWFYHATSAGRDYLAQRGLL
jgi:DNA anti-recombination protein RmuC